MGRRALLAALAGVLVLVWTGGLRAETEAGVGDWQGIWWVGSEGPDAGPAVLHVVIAEGRDGPAVSYYNPDFFRSFTARNVVLEGESLSFRSAVGSKEFEVRLERKGDSAKGEWTLRHPQFRISQRLVAYRVGKEPSGPLAESLWELSREKGFVSLAAELCRLGRGASWEEFLHSWNNEIVPTYYILLQDVVYDHGSKPEAWRQRIRALYDWVQVAENVAAVERFAETHAKVVERLKEKAPAWASGPLVVVEAVVGDAPSVRWIGTNSAVFLRLGLDSGKWSPDSRVRAWLACQHLTSPLLNVFPWVDQGVVAKVVRMGVAAYAATSLGLAERPDMCFLGGGERETDLQSGKEKIARAVKFRPAAREVDDSLLLQVGYDFARQVASTYPMESLPVLDRGRYAELLASYLDLH